VRDISHALIPEKFKQNPFTVVIREYFKSISSTGELQVGFHPHPEKDINAIDEKLQMEVYKIIQELMTNTVKHAETKNIDIHLSVIEDELSLLFEDNGKGFDPKKVTKGIGSQNIQNRVRELQGQINIDSTIARGTVVSVQIPLKPDVQ
jgi:signal transduction histidine kinase